MKRAGCGWILASILVASACGGGGYEPTDNLDDPSEEGDGQGGGQGGGNSDDPNVCAQIEAQLTKVTPTVVLLVDQSGSMTQNFAGQTRWNALYTTLMGANGVVRPLEADVRFGLTLYTSNNGGATCPVLTEVPPALNNYAAIDAKYAPADPIDDTPTGESIAAVAAKLRQVQEPGPKIIVLATDGEPDTCAVPDPQTPEAQQVSIRAAQDAFAAGIPTYVISVGDEVGEPHLRDMANAGAGLPVGGAMQAPYYRALNPTELVNAFQQIIGGVRTCTFTLNGTVSADAAMSGVVTLDGQNLEYGTEWRVVGGNILELLGLACDKLRDGATHDVRASFPCDAIVIN